MQIIRIMIIILSDKSPSSDIGAARFSPTQGSFHSVQLIGAGTHQVHVCAADILQPVSCKTVLRQSLTGSYHDLAPGNRQWSICCVAGNRFDMLEFCFCSQPLLKQTLGPVLRLCTCVDDGDIRRS